MLLAPEIGLSYFMLLRHRVLRGSQDCVGKIYDMISPKYPLVTGSWDIHRVLKLRCKIFSYPFRLQAVGSLIVLIA